MNHKHDKHTASTGAANPVAVIDISNAYHASEYSGLESYLRRLPGTVSVHSDWTCASARVQYYPSLTIPTRLEANLRECGYKCDCYHRHSSKAQAGHPRVSAEDQPGLARAQKQTSEAIHAAYAARAEAGHAATRDGA